MCYAHNYPYHFADKKNITNMIWKWDVPSNYNKALHLQQQKQNTKLL